MTAMRQPQSRIYLAGHTGLVGGAILRGLEARGYQNIVTRTHAQLDLTDQRRTRAFFARESPEVVIVAAARVGGILANWEHPWEFVAENLAIELNTIGEAFRAGVQAADLPGQLLHLPEAGAAAPEGGVPAHRPPGRDQPGLCDSEDRRHRTVPQPQPGVRDRLPVADADQPLRPGGQLRPGDQSSATGAHTQVPRGEGRQGGGRLGPGDALDDGVAVTLWGTGRPRREMLFVDDLADAVCLMLEGESWRDVPDGLLNVGTGEDAYHRGVGGDGRRSGGLHGPRPLGHRASLTAPRRSSWTSAASGISAGCR